jgi:hypothetical protein
MSTSENIVTKCITCGTELHPERAKKYNYCMSPECQAKNLKGLTMVAVGVNKSAEQYMLLDEETKTELAEGKYHDQRRGSFGAPTSGSAPAPSTPSPSAPSGNKTKAGPDVDRPADQGGPAAQPTAARPHAARQSAPRPQAARPAGRRPPTAGRQPRQPGTPSQRRLAVLYNQQGLRPDEIARKLGLSRYDVTQIILAGRSQGKL